MLLRAVFLLAMTVSVYGIARVDGTEELKRLARLPKIQLASPLEFDRHLGFVIFPDTLGLSEEAKRLQREIEKEEGQTTESAARWIEIGKIYDHLDNPILAGRFYRRAAEAQRRKVDLDPASARALAGLGSALSLLGRFDEARPHLQRALALAPERAESWLAMGTFHRERLWRLMESEAALRGSRGFLEALHEFMAAGADSSELDEAAWLLEQARECHDQAARLEPGSAEVFIQRGIFRAMEAAVRTALAALRDDTPAGQPLRASLVPPGVVEDFQRAADLDAENPARLGVAALLPLFAHLYAHRLPDSIIWEGGAPRTGDASSGVYVARLQALAADPSRERAWDLLTLELNRRGEFASLVEECSDRVLASPSARNFLFLAKAYERIGDYIKAEWIVLSALAASQNDFYANLALANLLMKRPDHGAMLPRAGDCITRVQRHLGPSPTLQNQIDLALTRALHLALSEQPEDARKVLRQVERLAGPHPEITAALQAIGY